MAVAIDEASKRLVGPGRGLTDAVSASHGRASLWLVVLSLVAFLPGFFTIPPVDRDEARFAQATKQMLESGDYVDIRLQEESRYKKPVGIYWLQVGVVKLGEAVGVPRAHTRIWLYRFPSLIGAIGAVLATYWAALAFVSRRAAVLAGMMLASCLLLGVEARLATTDAVLLFACVAAMGALGRAYMAGQGSGRDVSWGIAAVFWTALAGGILLKGPLILMFVGLCAVMLVTLGRSFDWLGRLKPLPGLVWMLLLVLPWFVAIVAKSGDSFFAESLGRDLFAKIGSGQESHGAPPGTYLVLFWVTFFPGAMLVPLVAPAIWRARGEPGTRFLLAWIVPAWIALEIVVTKLPHYVLPLYPAVAILIAGAVDAQVPLPRQRWLTAAPALWFIFAVLGAVGTIVLHVMVGQQAGFPAWPFLVAAIIVALFAWWLLRVDGVETALLRAIAATLLFGFALFGMTLPSIPRLFPAQELSKFVRFTAACADPQVATAGYHEDSLVFLTGTSLRHTNGDGAADFLKAGGCRFAFVESRQERAFAQRAETLGLRYSRVFRFDGINISGGRPIAVSVFRPEPTP